MRFSVKTGCFSFNIRTVLLVFIFFYTGFMTPISCADSHIYTAKELAKLPYKDFKKLESQFRAKANQNEKQFGIHSEQTLKALQNLALFLERDFFARKELISVLRKIIPLVQSLRGTNNIETGIALAMYGVALRKEKQYAQAESVLLDALEILRRNTGMETNRLIDVLDALSKIKQYTHHMDLAVKYAQESLSARKNIRPYDELRVAYGMDNLADMYKSMGQYKKAIPLCRRSISIYKKKYGSNSISLESRLTILAQIYDDIGLYAKALSLYQRALAMDKVVFHGDLGNIAIAQSNIAGVYKSLGEYSKALPLMKRAYENFRKARGDDNPNMAIFMNNLATMYHAMGLYNKALPLYKKSLAISLKSDVNSVGEAENVILKENAIVVLNNLARLNHETGKHKLALARYMQCLRLETKLLPRNHPYITSTMANLGYLFIKLGDYRDGQRILAKSIARALGQPGARESLWGAEYALAVLNTRLNKIDLAILWGKRAVNAIQQQRNDIKNMQKGLQHRFLTSRRKAYQDLADLLISAGRIPEAQQVLQMLKEQEFHSSLLRALNNDPRRTFIQLTGLERERFANFYKLQNRQVALENEREQLQKKQHTGTATPADLKRLQDINAHIMPVLQDAMTRFIQNLQTSSDRYSKGKNYRKHELSIALVDTNLEKVLANVQKHDPAAKIAALQYVVTDTRLSILLSTGDAPPLALQTSFDGNKLRNKILALRELLRNPESDPDRVKNSLTSLYSKLIAPISKDLKKSGATTVILVPNDVLRYVPFAALYDGKHYLVQDYTLTYFNEAVKKPFVNKKTTNWNLAAMGLTHPIKAPPLPALKGVRQELRAIAATSGLKETQYLDNDFTHATLVRSLGKDFNVLHLASHFQFVAGRPDASRLFLGDGSSLYLSEIARDNLRFDHFSLVTFSTCDSGLGGGLDADGREMESLGALVQDQGAQAVLATLWDVNDTSTADLMEAFYRARSQEYLGKAAALRAAQLSLLNNGGKFARPYYWAPFVLMGDWR